MPNVTIICPKCETRIEAGSYLSWKDHYVTCRKLQALEAER